MDTLLGFLSGLGTAVCKTATDLGTKYATQTLPERLILALQATCTAVLLWIVCIVVHPQLVLDTTAFSRAIGPNFWWVLVVDGGLNAVAFYCYIRAFRFSDASRVAPIMLFTPVLLLVTAPLILGQNIPLIGIVGVLCTVIGAFFLGSERGAWKRVLSVRFLVQDRGARYMLATAAIWSITSVLDKVGLDSAPLLLWSASINTMIALYSAVFLFAVGGVSSIRGVWRVCVPGTTNALGYLLQMLALQTLYVPYVIAIKRLSALGTVIGGGLFFGERVRNRLVGTIIMLSGTILMALGS